MTKAQFVSAVQRRMGFRSDLASEIVAEADIASVEIGGTSPFPWFLFSRVAITLDAVEYYMPTTLIELSQRFPIIYIDDPTKQLEIRPLEELETEFAPFNTASGRPRYAALAHSDATDHYGQQALRLYPTPDTSYAAVLSAFMHEKAPLSAKADGDTNLWLTYAPELLIVSTTRRLAVDSRDAELVGRMDQEERALRAELDRRTFARHEMGMDRIIREPGMQTSEVEE